jgi:hypothetical protein
LLCAVFLLSFAVSTRVSVAATGAVTAVVTQNLTFYVMAFAVAGYYLLNFVGGSSSCDLLNFDKVEFRQSV